MLGLFRKRTQQGLDSLREVIGAFELPSFRPVAMKALETIRSEDSTTAAVSKVLTGDPGLSVQVLRAVNSAGAGLRGEVNNLGHAVALLGLSRLESLIVGVAVRGALPHVCYRGFDPSRFWRTAALRAALAQELAAILHPAIRIECFTSALLQDMAVPLLAASRTEQYGPLLERWYAGEGRLQDLEREAFGWDHTLVGGHMCDAWGLPESLGQAMRGHHGDPAEAGCPPAVALVSEVIDGAPGPEAEAFIARLADCYGLPEPVAADLLEKGRQRAGEIASLIGIH